MGEYALQAEEEMWSAIASRPPEVCDRCGRELAGGLPSPCPRCSEYTEAQRRPGGCDHWLEIDGREGYCAKPAGHVSVHALSV